MTKSKNYILLSLLFSNFLYSQNKDDCLDYIIVGFGTAGCVLTRYLSDKSVNNGKNKILVLEQGLNRSDDPIVKEGLNINLEQLGALAYNPKYAKTQVVYEPEEGILKTQAFSGGKMWFGASGHNGMFAVRGSADIYDEIAKIANNPRWTYKNLLPFMKHLEHFHPKSSSEVVSSQRGLHGILQITQFPDLDESNPFLKAISQVTNTPFVPDYNISSAAVALSPFQAYVYPKTLDRSYGYDFLPKELLSSDGKGLQGRKIEVVSGATVDKVIFKCNKAIGVSYIDQNGKSKEAFAKKKIILCAGVPFSATILQRSGIGPKDLLNKLNINPIVENENVGKYLRDHFAVIAGIKGQLTGVNAPKLQAFLDGYPSFISTPDKVRRFQFVGLEGLAVPDAALTALGITDRSSGFTIDFVNLRRKGVGSAEIVEKTPGVIPNIKFNVYQNPEDQRAAIDSYKITNLIVEQANINAGQEEYSMIYPPADHFTASNADELLLLDAKAMLANSYLSELSHYTGTCNMGTSVENGVVDGDLHVFGVKNLMVADNSIYPLIETGNTAWTAYLAGAMAANILGYQLPN